MEILASHSKRRFDMRQFVLGGAIVAAFGLAGARPAHAQSSGPTLFRIFLTVPQAIGSLVSYGEYARLGDQVVFSLPVGDLASPRLQLVSIPADAVDWLATERYALSARYSTYLSTRAAMDFSVMSTEVAEALNRVALTDDPDTRLRVAEHARLTLVGWPQRHFGYRSDDIRGYVRLLDEIISELRLTTNTESFDLSFEAVPETSTEPMLPQPDFRESLQQALAAAGLTQTPAERVSLLQSIVSAFDDSTGWVELDGARDVRERATVLLDEEQRVGRSYARLASTILSRADAVARDADVRGVERVLHTIDSEDAKLGRARPQAVTALRLAVEQTLDDTRALRLSRDQWAFRRQAYRRYEEATREPLKVLANMEPLLDDIKVLAGPDRRALDDLERRVSRYMLQLNAVGVPTGLQTVHGLVTAAFQFAESAVRMRRQAVASGDMRTAWDASSAAAAAMMLRTQTLDRLERLLEIPQLR